MKLKDGIRLTTTATNDYKGAATQLLTGAGTAATFDFANPVVTGTPSYVWGWSDNDKQYYQRYNPANFSVNYATTTDALNSIASAPKNDSLDVDYHDNKLRYFLGKKDTSGLKEDSAILHCAWSSQGWEALLAIGASKSGHLYFRGQSVVEGSASWSDWKTVLDSANFNNYAPSLTGYKASGTWGINITGSAGSVAWGNVTGKSDYTTRWPTWSEVTDKPTTFTPSTHTHARLTNEGAIKDINAKQESGLFTYYSNLVSTDSGKAGYAISTYGFPVTNNANGLLAIHTHAGAYEHLLGFSSNGKIYHRSINGIEYPETLNGGSWKVLAYASDITNALSSYLPLTGGTINGDITLTGKYQLTGSQTIAGNLTVEGDSISLKSKSIELVNNSKAINLPSSAGTLALTSLIPTVTNYYWANVKISSSSSITTAPTFGSLKVTGTLTTSGNITAPGFYQSSDLKLKTDINPISEDLLSKIADVDLVHYKYIHGKRHHYGVIALDIEKLGLEDLVFNGNEYKTVDYISLLCLKIKYLEEEIKKLKNG